MATTMPTITLPMHNDVWYRWTAYNGTTPITQTYAAQTVTWNQWVGTGTGSTYTFNDWTQRDIWAKWSVRDVAIPEINTEIRERYEAEQRRIRDEVQAAREEASRRRLAAAPLVARAADRALELLEMILTPEEKLYREEHDGDIQVRGGHTGNLYVVSARNSVHGNIKLIDEHGCLLGRLCVQPSMNHHTDEGDYYAMPLADGWVGQILSIKHNEEELLRKANWSHRRECQQPNVPILRAA